jgi:hypothetical protein
MADSLGVAHVATATQRRGNIDSVTTDDKTDHDKARSVRARQRALGREIRRMFDNVAKEPVPDDFLDLLRRIDESDSEGGATAVPKS